MNRNSLRKMEDSEIIDINGGALYEGYNGVICSPFVLGKIPDEIRKAVKAAYMSQQVVAEHMKPGALSTELYKIYSNFLEKEGYRQFSPYGSVHSLGMLECETPFFSAHRDVEMIENMVIAVDVYFKNLPWGSFRIEDTYIIRKDGAELATQFNKSFIPQLFL